MIGHGLGPGGRDWFLEEGEETHLRMSVWYCGSCCGCGLKKVVLQKVLLVEVSLEKYMFG